MDGLDNIPGADSSYANGVSGNGSVVVGYGKNADGDHEAFRWTASDGMQSVYHLLFEAGVHNMERGILEKATGVSADGTVISFDLLALANYIRRQDRLEGQAQRPAESAPALDPPVAADAALAEGEVAPMDWFARARDRRLDATLDKVADDIAAAWE